MVLIDQSANSRDRQLQILGHWSVHGKEESKADAASSLNMNVCLTRYSLYFSKFQNLYFTIP